MDNKKTSLFFGFIFLFVSLQTVFGQASHITTKTSSSKSRALNALIDTFKKEEQYFQQRIQSSRETVALTLPVKQIDGTMVALHTWGTDGTPLYYSSFASPTGEVSRASSLYTGGSLDLGITGQGMQVGIWDAGIALQSHQEFDNRVLQGDSSSIVDFHATMVTGVLASSGIQREAQGVAFEAEVLSHNWTRDRIEVAEAAANGLLLSNHSYGIKSDRVPDWYFGSYIKISQDWDNIMYHAPYYLMVSASGNAQNSYDNDEPIYGKTKDGFDLLLGFTTAKNGIVVAGADTNLHSNGTLQSAHVSSYSSFGPTDDGRIKPDIAGDGALIHSTSDNGNTSYSKLRGTSMAAPGVTGSLLLLQSYHKELFGTPMKAATLKGLALHTADDVEVAGPDYKMGWGVINTKRAAQVLTNHEYSSLLTEETLESGDTYSITVEVNGDEPLLASLSWTDPASENINKGVLNSSTPVLVNDLDIQITKNGEVYHPWRLDAKSSTLPATKGDNSVDPFERIDIMEPKGQYTITITHKGELVHGTQEFSLILSGISLSNCKLIAPLDIFLDEPKESEVSWYWEAAPETLYEVQTQEENGENWESQLTWENTVAMENLKQGHTYKLRIRAICSTNLASEFSEESVFEFNGVDTIVKVKEGTPQAENRILNVYPSPAKDYITVDDPIVENIANYTVTTLSGFIVKQGSVSNKINVSDLATGVYLLSVGDGQHLKSSKFFKK